MESRLHISTNEWIQKPEKISRLDFFKESIKKGIPHHD
jgi:hypothetical protein